MRHKSTIKEYIIIHLSLKGKFSFDFSSQKMSTPMNHFLTIDKNKNSKLALHVRNINLLRFQEKSFYYFIT